MPQYQIHKLQHLQNASGHPVTLSKRTTHTYNPCTKVSSLVPHQRTHRLQGSPCFSFTSWHFTWLYDILTKYRLARSLCSALSVCGNGMWHALLSRPVRACWVLFSVAGFIWVNSSGFSVKHAASQLWSLRYTPLNKKMQDSNILKKRKKHVTVLLLLFFLI